MPDRIFLFDFSSYTYFYLYCIHKDGSRRYPTITTLSWARELAELVYCMLGEDAFASIYEEVFPQNAIVLLHPKAKKINSIKLTILFSLNI